MSRRRRRRSPWWTRRCVEGVLGGGAEFAALDRVAVDTEAGELAVAGHCDGGARQGAVIDIALGAGEEGLELFAIDAEVFGFG